MQILKSTKMLGAPSWRQLARQSCGLTRADLAKLTGENPRYIRRVESDAFLELEAELDPLYRRLEEIARKLIHLPARASGAKSQSKYAKAKAIDRPALSKLEAAEHLIVRQELGLLVPAATEERANNPTKRGRGRPKLEAGVPSADGNPKLQTRVGRDTYRQIEQEAKQAGLSLSDWTRLAVLEKLGVV
jgi:transcriptional regulator with XRE-family HTH domain